MLEGEEVHAQAVGEGEEAFREEYVTGDVTPKEYDYSYRDYPEPSVETGDMDGGMGPALSAVTDEGGVSCFACSTGRSTTLLPPALSLCVCCVFVSSQVQSYKTGGGASFRVGVRLFGSGKEAQRLRVG